jgi:hypothetical protein
VYRRCRVIKEGHGRPARVLMWLGHPVPGRPWSVPLHILNSQRIRHFLSCFFCLQVFRLYRIETPMRGERRGLREEIQVGS